MKNKPLIFSRFSTLLNRPDWRFYVFENPTKDCQEYIRTKTKGAYLKRFSNELVDNLKLTTGTQQIFNSLNEQEQNEFTNLQRDELKERDFKKKEFTHSNDIPKNNTKWRVKDLENIKDEYLVKLIKHYCHVQHDENIEFAVVLRKDQSQDVLFRNIGYHIYLKLNDAEIAKKFFFKIKQIEAIRKLFFDFSNRPNDSIAHLCYLKQLVMNGVADEADYHFYKLIEDLGPDIAIKSKFNFNKLTDIEFQTLKQYLSKSHIENILQLKESVRTGTDALNFNKVISGYHSLQLANESNNVRNKLLATQIIRTETDTEKIKSTIITEVKEELEEDKLLLEYIKADQLKINPPPEVKTLDDLK